MLSRAGQRQARAKVDTDDIVSPLVGGCISAFLPDTMYTCMVLTSNIYSTVGVLFSLYIRMVIKKLFVHPRTPTHYTHRVGDFDILKGWLLLTMSQVSKTCSVCPQYEMERRVMQERKEHTERGWDGGREEETGMLSEREIPQIDTGRKQIGGEGFEILPVSYILHALVTDGGNIYMYMYMNKCTLLWPFYSC